MGFKFVVCGHVLHSELVSQQVGNCRIDASVTALQGQTRY
jgi:hypothetical protein